MDTAQRNGRRRVIEEIVARWKAKNPDTLKIFADNVKEMRQERITESKAMSYKATLPGDLFRQLDYAVSTDGDARLFDPDGELTWFADKYPEFIIPYDRTSLAR